MSNEALAWAWKVPCPPTAKLVLVALADRANTAGECFPSSRDIIERTGLAERTVRLALRELERAGHLRTEFRAGRSTIYVVSMAAQRGASDAGGQEMPGGTRCRGGGHDVPGRGAPDAGEGGTTCPHNHQVTQTEPTPNPQSGATADAPTPDKLTGGLLDLADTAKPAGPAKPAKPPKVAARLDDDWQPSPKGIAFAEERGVDWQREAMKFRNHWHAKPGKDGLKLDWSRTWQNWVLTAEERMSSRNARPIKTSQWSVDEQNAELMRLVRTPDYETETTLLRLAR